MKTLESASMEAVPRNVADFCDIGDEAEDQCGVFLLFCFGEEGTGGGVWRVDVT